MKHLIYPVYSFHYDRMLQWFPKAHLLFTDTDSLYYHIEEPDVEQKLYERRANYLDYSDYFLDDPHYDASNRMKVGYFKDETSGAPIKEFAGLKAKVYSLLIQGSSGVKEKQRLKGVTRAAAKALKHKEYVHQLNHREENRQINRRIGQKGHKLFTIEVYHSFVFTLSD